MSYRPDPTQTADESVFSSAAAPPDRGVGAFQPPTPRSLHPMGSEVKVSPPPKLEEVERVGVEGKKVAKDRMRWRNIEIKNRDIRLLTLLLHQKFLTLEQVHRSCFPGLSLQMPRMRMRKLGHFGLVQTRRVYTESRQVYLLSRPGYRCLEARGISRDLGFADQIDLRVFEHDKAVTDLRLSLESAGVGPWKSERELRQERPGARVADAIFGLGGRAVALEFENADKGAERYRAIFLDHLDRPVAHHVLYVVRAPERLESLPRILESLGKRRLGLDLGRISFAAERAVLNLKLDASVINLRRGNLKLAGL